MRLPAIQIRNELYHYGVKGMKWGVRRSPEQLGHRKPAKQVVAKSSDRSTIVQDAIRSGSVLKRMNREKQLRHTLDEHIPGRSYLNGGLEFAQRLIDEYNGKGNPIMDKKGYWTNKEKFDASNVIGTHVDTDGTETKTNKGIISYSKTGTHVYPRKEEK